MAEFVIYTKNGCPYCVQAKGLLNRLGHRYEEKNVSENKALFPELLKLYPETKTVPQIFLGKTRIGGYTDLAALVERGELEPLIANVGESI